MKGLLDTHTFIWWDSDPGKISSAALTFLRDAGNEAARVMFSLAMWMAALVAPVQVVAGDVHGLNTLEHQPAKIAAIEGHFETRRGQPLILSGWPELDEVTIFGREVLPLVRAAERRQDEGGIKDGE